MRTKQTAPKDIDEYIAGFPNDVQEILDKIRMTIRKAAPDAEETISYQIPTFTLKGRYLVYFAAYKKHIGLYPAPRGIEEFKEELSVYEGGKGTVRFPLDKPIPFDLIRKIVKFRVKESLERAQAKVAKTWVSKNLSKNLGVRSTLYTGTFLSFLSNLRLLKFMMGRSRVRLARLQFRERLLVTSSFSLLNPSPF